MLNSLKLITIIRKEVVQAHPFLSVKIFQSTFFVSCDTLWKKKLPNPKNITGWVFQGRI